MNYLNKYFDFFGKKVKKLIKKPIDEICTVRNKKSLSFGFGEKELPISSTRRGNYLYWDNTNKKIQFSSDMKMPEGSTGFFFSTGDGFEHHLTFHDEWSIKTVKLPILFNDVTEIIKKVDPNLEIYSGYLGYNGRDKYNKLRKGSYCALPEFFFNFSILDNCGEGIPSDIFNEYKNEISRRLESKRSEYLSRYDIDENSNLYKILHIGNNTTDDRLFGQIDDTIVNDKYGKISLSIGIDFHVDYCDMPKGHDKSCSVFHAKG